MLPLDINKLICIYVTKPNYIFDESIKGFAEYIGYDRHVLRLSPGKIDSLLSNPKIVQTDLLNDLAKFKAPGELITKLSDIHSPLAIKSIMRIDNWLDILHELCVSGDSPRTELLKNPYAGPILDKLYELNPNVFYDEEPEHLLMSKSAENIITDPNFISNYPMKLSELLTNPSELVFEKLQLYTTHIANSIYSSDNLQYLLKNTNTNLLSLAIPHIQKYIGSGQSVDFTSLNSTHKKLLNSYMKSLIFNPNPFASKLLEQIITNLENHDILELMSQIDDSELMHGCASDYIVDLVIKYLNSRITVYYKWHRLRFSTNPKAIRIIKDKLSASEFNRISNDIAANPGAIEIIKENPKQFMMSKLLANPAIFVPETNKQLVERVCRLTEF